VFQFQLLVVVVLVELCGRGKSSPAPVVLLAGSNKGTMGSSSFIAAIGSVVRSLSAIADGACALPRLGVYVLLLLGKNEDRSTLLRGQSKLLENGRFGSGVLLGILSLFTTVVVFGLVAVESFVIVDPYGFLRGVGPSQLDRASLQAAGMVAEDLRVRPYLAVPKRDHRFVV